MNNIIVALLNEKMIKINFVDLEKLYNFVVEKFFIWIHLVPQNCFEKNDLPRAKKMHTAKCLFAECQKRHSAKTHFAECQKMALGKIHLCRVPMALSKIHLCRVPKKNTRQSRLCRVPDKIHSAKCRFPVVRGNTLGKHRNSAVRRSTWVMMASSRDRKRAWDGTRHGGIS